MLSEINHLRQKRKSVNINITSLIDVMFMLLIFFVVTTTFKEQPAIKVELPNSQTASSAVLEDHVLTVTKEGALYLNDQRYKKESLLEELKLISQKNKKASVVLRADEYVPYGAIVELMDMVRASKIQRIVALTETAKPVE